MVLVRDPICAGLPSWVIESAFLPGSPFCADDDFGLCFPRSFTLSELFHEKLNKAGQCARDPGVLINFYEIQACIPKNQNKSEAEFVSRFFKSGSCSVMDLLGFAKFLFQHEKNQAAFGIVEAVIKCSKIRRRLAAA